MIFNQMNTKIFGEFEVNKIKSILCNYAHNAKKIAYMLAKNCNEIK